jgi:hypothetical protein
MQSSFVNKCKPECCEAAKVIQGACRARFASRMLVHTTPRFRYSWAARRISRFRRSVCHLSKDNTAEWSRRRNSPMDGPVC